MEKIGIIGYQGFVGSAFYEVFSACTKCSVHGIGKLNIEQARMEDYDLLINCNGNSSKQVAEKDPQRDFQMNAGTTLDFLLNFKYGAYIHISTCEVYHDKSSQKTTQENAKIESLALSNYGFSKYVAEQAVKRFARRWLILRLSGMVGKNMKKGPAYDIISLQKLFISEKSKYQYIGTVDVARIAKTLVDMGKWGETYNIVGKGNIKLSEFARIAGVALKETGEEVQVFDISTEKIEKEIGYCPTSAESVARHVKNCR